MAFPGTYNFNYYKGDTYQFKIYPKNSAGDPFDLQPFLDAQTGAVHFTIAEKRGNGATTIIPASAIITTLTGQQCILCTIRPADGEQLTGGSSYVYDVQIKDTSSVLYPYIYTLLTGTITVTDEVTTPEISNAITVIPNAPTNFAVVGSPTSSSITFSWSSPSYTTNNVPTGYTIVRNTSASIDGAVPIATLAISDGTSYTDTNLSPNTVYYYGIIATNSAGPSLQEVAIAYMTDPQTAPILMGYGMTGAA